MKVDKPALAAVLMVAALLGVFERPLPAQTVGATLQGRVKDETGGALPHGQVAITNLATGVTTTVATNGEGFYRAPNLLPGAYDAIASADGFLARAQKGITLTVGAERMLDFVMTIGNINETVEVSSQAAAVDTASSALRHNVGGTTIRELPLNGRDWTRLTTLLPGVAAVGTSGGTRSGNGLKMAISGARPSENNFRLNGVSVNDYANTTPGNALGTNLGVEAVQEFSVLTNSYSAEYGRTSGGVVNAITRSGTNQVSGTIFGFHRNSALDARNFFDRGDEPADFRRTQYGVAAGGPVVRNRTFWFADYEGVRELLEETSILNTLSAAARAGQLSTGAVSVDPQIARVLDLLPLPNGSLLGAGDTGEYLSLTANESRGDYFLGKADHKLSDRHSVSVTYFIDDAQIDQPDGFGNKLVSNDSRRQAAIGENTNSIGASLVNVNRFGFSRTVSNSGLITDVYNPLLLDTSLGYLPGFTIGSLSVPGLSNPGGGPGSVDYASLDFRSFQASADLYWLKGAHSIKVGMNVEHMQNRFDTPNLTGGQYAFGTIADFLRNRPSRFGALFPESDTRRDMRQTLVGGYIQDDFRLRTTLTLNLGVRYEMMTIPTEVDGKVALLHGLTDPAVTVGGAIHDRNPTLLNFAPRVGFAWDAFGRGTTSVRAGFGMFDVLPFLYLYETPLNRSTPLFLQGVALNPPAGSFPSGAYERLGVQNLRTAWVDPEPPRAFRTQWNLNVQQKVLDAWTVEVGYVGARGVNLPLVERNMNTVLPAREGDRWVYPDRATSRVLNPNFSAINTTVTWNADSWYHALQTSLKRNLSSGVQVQASYTWSKSIDTGSSISSVSSGTGYESSFAVATPLIPEINRGPSNYDLRHNAVFSFVWELPAAGRAPAVVRSIVNGWQLAAIYRVHSGYPFTLNLNGDRAGSKADTTGSSLGQAPDVVDSPECRALTNPGNPDAYIKTECFAFPAAGVLGNLGRNSLSGPGLANLDLMLGRRIPVGRGVAAQLRLEAFNALNRANFATPATTIFDNAGRLTPNVGRISSTRTPNRQIQIGVKLLW